MTPDPISPSAGRTPRGPVRFIAALCLVAVTAACGTGGDHVATVGSTAAPSSVVTASPDVNELPPEPTVTQGGGIEGPYVLRIPRIGVDAQVVPIKSDEEGILEPPRDLTVAGWWSDGAAPGEAQVSAVLVGHSVRYKGGGVFDDVGYLSRGDAIELEGSNSKLTYRVQSIDVLSKDDSARNAEQIFDQTEAGRLVVITCGDFDGTVWAVQRRDHRGARLIVVWASSLLCPQLPP
jgi:LPXTG-site transpeptidase (sortase) family protein